MDRRPHQSAQQWKGPERRQSLARYRGENRRRIKSQGYRAGEGTPGVNAEEPKTEQDYVDLHRSGGPDPRITK